MTNYLIAQTKLYKELENPNWIFTEKHKKKFIKIWKNLKDKFLGIPWLPDEDFRGFYLLESGKILWIIYRDIVIRFNQNIIEIKNDFDRSFENELLRGAPESVRKEIFVGQERGKINLTNKNLNFR